jgi:hypothetical protein
MYYNLDVVTAKYIHTKSGTLTNNMRPSRDLVLQTASSRKSSDLPVFQSSITVFQSLLKLTMLLKLTKNEILDLLSQKITLWLKGTLYTSSNKPY